MARTSKKISKQGSPTISREIRSTQGHGKIAKRAAAGGLQSSAAVVDVMDGLVQDLLNGDITPNVSNAACNAVGKMQKQLELEAKYGKSGIYKQLKS